MGSYGKIDRSAYPSQRTSPESIATLENAVVAWLARETPGAFTSRDAVGLYETARRIRVVGPVGDAGRF